MALGPYIIIICPHYGFLIQSFKSYSIKAFIKGDIRSSIS